MGQRRLAWRLANQVSGVIVRASICIDSALVLGASTRPAEWLCPSPRAWGDRGPSTKRSEPEVKPILGLFYVWNKFQDEAG